jgi:hypothetical protein
MSKSLRMMSCTGTSTLWGRNARRELPLLSRLLSLGSFTCLDHSGESASGPAMQLTAVRVAHQPGGYDRTSSTSRRPLGSAAHIPAYTVSAGIGEVHRGSEWHARHDARVGGPSHRLPWSERRHELQRQSGSYSQSSRRAGSRATWRLRGSRELGRRSPQASCIRTIELSNPTRLVIDVQTP